MIQFDDEAFKLEAGGGSIFLTCEAIAVEWANVSPNLSFNLRPLYYVKKIKVDNEALRYYIDEAFN